MKTVGRKSRRTRRRRPLRIRKRVMKPYRRSHTRMTKSMPVIPQRLITKLKYNETHVFSLSRATNTTQYLFPAITPIIQYRTSLYDPNWTSGVIQQHQPYWYDQWTPSIYNNYRVFGIKYRIEAVADSEQALWWVGVRHALSDVQLSPGDFRLAMENPQCIMRRCTSWATPNQCTILSGYMSTAKTLGVPYRDVADDGYYASVYNDNPTKMAYLQLFAATTRRDSDPEVKFNVRLTFYCELFGNSTPPIS